MLKKILSVSGKPGLFKLVSNSKTITLVESLIDEKRFPIYPHEKIVSLGEIAIYTTEDEVPLKDIFLKIKEKENGEKISDDKKGGSKELFSYFQTILPNYDKEKVYASDIKKIINWYNLLIENDIDFETEEETENQAEESPEVDEQEVSDKEETSPSEEEEEEETQPEK